MSWPWPAIAGRGHLTTFLFMRFVTPFVLFVLAFLYLRPGVLADRPLYLNAVYAHRPRACSAPICPRSC